MVDDRGTRCDGFVGGLIDCIFAMKLKGLIDDERRKEIKGKTLPHHSATTKRHKQNLRHICR